MLEYLLEMRLSHYEGQAKPPKSITLREDYETKGCEEWRSWEKRAALASLGLITPTAEMPQA